MSLNWYEKEYIMESISTLNSVIPHSHKNNFSEKTVPTIEAVDQEKQSNLIHNKYLQPDQVEISEASRKKLSASENKNPQESADIEDKVMSKKELVANNEANESNIDKEIRKLSMEILELSIQIQMLEGKENKESLKEKQELEVELAMKKGVLDAAIGRKLQIASLS